ncbi:MAG: hypothetical protein JNL11_05855 [Bdellovibrionaceae bacterium]|nr:hypothetical protein [Pseudobdellovibrionaceae bacterium]
MSQDDFKSLKDLGRKISRPPTTEMMQTWKKIPFKTNRRRRPSRFPHNSSPRSAQWLQLAAALLVGLIIGKFVWHTSSDIFSEKIAKNHVADETFEYVYTNN